MTKRSEAAIAASVVFERRATHALSTWSAFGPTGWPGYGNDGYSDVQLIFCRDLTIDRWAKIPPEARRRLEWAEKQAAVASQAGVNHPPMKPQSQAAINAYIAFDRRLKAALSALSEFDPDEAAVAATWQAATQPPVDRWARLPRDVRSRLEQAEAHAAASGPNQAVTSPGPRRLKLPYGAVTVMLKRGMVPTGPSLDAIGTWLEGVDNPWPEVEAGVAAGLLSSGEYAFLSYTHGGPLEIPWP